MEKSNDMLPRYQFRPLVNKAPFLYTSGVNYYERLDRIVQDPNIQELSEHNTFMAACIASGLAKNPTLKEGMRIADTAVSFEITGEIDRRTAVISLDQEDRKQLLQTFREQLQNPYNLPHSKLSNGTNVLVNALEAGAALESTDLNRQKALVVQGLQHELGESQMSISAFSERYHLPRRYEKGLRPVRPPAHAEPELVQVIRDKWDMGYTLSRIAQDTGVDSNKVQRIHRQHGFQNRDGYRTRNTEIYQSLYDAFAKLEESGQDEPVDLSSLADMFMVTINTVRRVWNAYRVKKGKKC